MLYIRSKRNVDHGADWPKAARGRALQLRAAFISHNQAAGNKARINGPRMRPTIRDFAVNETGDVARSPRLTNRGNYFILVSAASYRAIEWFGIASVETNQC